MSNPFPQELYDFFDEKIKKYFQNQEVRIYLFGSRARGDHHPRSDYDLGIKFPDTDSTKKINLCWIAKTRFLHFAELT
jgi:predicted nucleotidyltransferase